MLVVAGELAVRLARGALTDFAPATERLGQMTVHHPMNWHARLGYTPRPGASVSPRGEQTHDALGLRLHVDAPPAEVAASARPILAVGDSFTYGGEVDDDESWPAELQRRLGRPVWNGAVPGYGFDQTVLRAEQLVPLLRPSLLLVGVIPDDVRRCTYSTRFAPKPYFTLAGDGLELHNVPVPRETAPALARPLKHALGVSHLADALLSRWAPDWWYLDVRPVRRHDDGPEVARRLVDRLADFAEAQSLPVVIVVQGSLTANTNLVQPLMTRARERELQVLNVLPVLRRRLKQDPSLAERWFRGHMTAEGNAWVAERVAAHVEWKGL